MTLMGTRCRECGETRFPPPTVCECGSQDLRLEPVGPGWVAARTRRAGSRRPLLVVVETAAGHRIVASAPDDVATGAAVSVECRSGMICAVPAQAAVVEEESTCRS